MRKGLMRIVT